MLTNYFKIAFRSLLKNKGFSLINILGLAIGITCSLLIFLFVENELSYDKYHKDAENIYRVAKDFVNDDGSRIPDATTPAPLAPAMQKELPEIASTTRIPPNWGRSYLVKYKDKKLTEEKILANRVDIKWWVFLLAAIIALVIAFVTISFQTIKAALANPIKNLRTE